MKYKATFHLDADGSLVQREHWDDKEVTATHKVEGDDWTAVSLLHFLLYIFIFEEILIIWRLLDA